MDSAEHLDDRAWRPGSDGEHLLQRRLDTVDRADRFYDDQVLDHLNARMREFIDRQEMFFLATADGHGECDNTFRAGPPGFLRALDARTLAYPEYRGNGVLASLGNIQENPHVGILMVDFFRDRIGLHVNGRARVVEDAEMREAHPGLPVDPVPGRRAVVWVEVTVEEAYIHCAKHIPHLQKVPAQRRTGGGDNRHRGPSGDQAIEHDRERDWGTDDVKRKGGDFFGAAAEARDGRRTPPTPPTTTGPTPRPADPPAQPAPAAPVGPAVRVLLAPPVPYAPVVPGTQTLAMAAVSGPQTPVTPAAPAVPGLQTPPVPYAPVVPGARPLAMPAASGFETPAAMVVPGPQALATPAVSASQAPPAAQAEPADSAGQAPQPSVARADLSPAIRPEVRPDAGPETWREEAERVLAEARQRAARKTQQPFGGWFR